MEEQKSSPQKKTEGSQRLGKLSTGFITPTQRPGRLNGGLTGPPSFVKQEDQPGPSYDSARGPSSSSGVSESKAVQKKIFRPNVPSKNDPRRRTASSAAAFSTAARDNEAFKELIKQAQSDKGWQEKSRQTRPQQSSPVQAAPIGLLPSKAGGQAAPGRASRSSAAPSRGAALAGKASASAPSKAATVAPRDDAILSEDEDYGMDVGQVPGPMLDYTRYYPTTLPMHQPRHDSSEASAASDEGEESMAAKLQLLAEGPPGELLVLVQVPDLLPSAAPPPAPDLAAARQRSLRREDQPPAAIAQGLKNLPAGKIGQLVVYESGAVKMRIGSVLYDLEPGISPGIREEVAAISLGDAPACPFLGEVQRHAVITPDLDHLLSEQPMPALIPEAGLWTPPKQPAVQEPADSATPMDIDVKAEV